MTPSVRPLGARRSLVELVKALPPSVDPMIVCSSDSGICLELKDLGIPTRVVPHGAWRKVGGRLKALFQQIPALRGIMAEFRPDAIHCNEFHSVPQAVQSSTKIPILGHIRLSITPRQIDTYSLNRCARIITVSRAVQSLFQNTEFRDRVKVIYNGVDIAAITSPPTSPDLTPQWRNTGKPDPLVFGLFGLISARKNQLVAVEATARAAAAGANVKLLIAGDAFGSSEAYGAALRQRLSHDDVRNHVAWIPFHKDAAALYRCIDVNLLISAEEGFGRTIIEAGAASHPSIGSRIGGIPELIEEDRTGWLVDEGDAVQLSERMQWLERHRDAVHQAGIAASARVADNFTIQAHVRNMVETWRECVATHVV
ncbi:glycosyltransferase family 4 protein [Candidatus Sumerlaeota bacterium]|nr:glycosyltransferase family 4 protein [Candidatus Sumerlaeota bacterium]